MRVMTVLGTRPEIIRLSRVIPLLDGNADHTLVHTGQNYAETLSEVFFVELGLREPDIHLGVRADSFGDQVGQILAAIEPVMSRTRPERVLILGDTNSGLVSLVASRLGVPVYHMEAGNRCYDDRVPEELNRRVIDHASSVLMPYTQRSRENLLREGIEGHRIYVTGNPIKQVIDHYADLIAGSDALTELGVDEAQFFLVTLHRAENVDLPDRLQRYVEAFQLLHKEYGFPIVCSLHPRTKSKVQEFGIDIQQTGLTYLDPLGFFDFIRLQQSAFCILSDSGTVQEEACLFGQPNVTLRDVTERPETLDSGSNVLGGSDPQEIVSLVEMVTGQAATWRPPAEYLEPSVAETVVRIVLGYRENRRDVGVQQGAGPADVGKGR